MGRAGTGGAGTVVAGQLPPGGWARAQPAAGRRPVVQGEAEHPVRAGGTRIAMAQPPIPAGRGPSGAVAGRSAGPALAESPWASTLGGGAAPPGGSGRTGSGAVAQEAVDLGAYAGPLRFSAPDGVTLEVPEVGSLTGTLEARLTGDGDVRLINDLSLEAYVEGIAEMPSRWPMEALKAQAVAARTYAWYQMRLGTFRERGYDICPSTACQVFRGREPATPRWRRAVAATAGEVLMSGGEPILARYFSTSGGHTVGNEEVFDEGPRPYLKGVPDPQDAVSPVHRWEVPFSREEMDEILAQGQTLSAAVPLADLELVAVEDGPDQVRVTGRDGRRATVSAPEFRRFVSEVAPRLFPDRFPSRRADGSAPLPTTLPSSRLSFTVTPDAVVVEGRGWGHGVGMGQWGAMGKAELGWHYERILATYYGGLEPTTARGLPERIRVGLSTTDQARVRADGPFAVLADGTAITPRGLGTWTVSSRPDRTLGLLAPTGYGAPLVVSPTTVSRDEPTEVEVVTLEAVVNKPVELAVEVSTAGGGVVARHEPRVVEAGRHEVAWSLDREGGRSLPPGEYRARLVGVDEAGTSAGGAVPVRVRPVTVPDSQPPSLLGPAPATSPRLPVAPAVVALLGALLGAAIGGTVPVRR